MTRAEKCLADAVTAGKIDQRTADNASARVQDLLDKGLPEAEAMQRAADEIAKAAARKQREFALRVIAAERTQRQAAAHPRGFAAGVASLFGRDIFGLAGYSSVEGRALAIEGLAHARLAGLLDAFRAKKLGFAQDLPGLRKLVYALYGDTANAASTGFAQAWRNTTDDLVDRFNAAGGNISRRETWRLPQHWNRDNVRRAGQGAFTDAMEAAIDAGDLRIADFDTGEPVPRAAARKIIEDAYERIRTNGVVDMVPGQPGGVALANGRNQPRAFEWTSAEAYLRFNETWGEGDAGLFELLTGHIRGISRDIAMLEILGPNAMHQARVLIDLARKREQPAAAVRMLGHIWNQVNGASSVPSTEWLAQLMGGVRSWLTSAQLGSALLSSATDFGTIRQTAVWNGLPATQVMQRYVSLLDPRNAEDRLQAVRLGLIADGWTRRAIAATRHQTDVVGRDLPGRIADFTMRISGQNAHTEAARWSFGIEFSAALADSAGKTLAELDPAMRRSFARYGITAEDWDLIRTHGVMDVDGVRFIMPDQLANGPSPRPGAGPIDGQAMQAARTAASRYLEMVQTETRFAVVEPGAAERAAMLGSSQPGTVGGEFRRAIAQYKSFPVAMLTRHVMRGIEGIRGGDHGAYLAATAVSLTVMGALVIQLKAIAQGKDPRDMTAPNFWGAAFMQGGGAGLLGDFLYAGFSRTDGDMLAAMAGPTFGLARDVTGLTAGNVLPWLQSERDSNFGAELARFVQRNTPGTSLWYSRLAVDRLLWNRLQDMLDPHAARRWRRMEQRALDDYDQRFWWTPGDTAPERAVNLPAAFGEPVP